jgi:outer membrane protein
MKIKFSMPSIALILYLYLSISIAKEARPLSLDEAMHLAEINSPSLSAAEFNEIAAKKSIDIARAAYYPTINAEAIDSVGFPGSSNVLGIEGLMGSPFRKGVAGGIVAQQIIWDFGRTFYSVETAKHEAESTHQNTRVTVYQVKQFTLQLYYECSKFRTLRDDWSNLSKESAIITKEALHFVNTGQVSIVDKYLSKAETERAITAEVFFAEQMHQAINQLAVLMGISSNTFTCPRLSNRLTSTLNPNTPIDQSPFLWRAVADANAAQAKLEEAKAGFMPKIVAVASTGDMEKTNPKTIKKTEYAAGIGITLPLFNLEVRGNIQRAAALAVGKNQEVCAQKLFLEETNAKYDRLICSSEVRLHHLSYQFQLAKKAFKVAKERYFTLEGNLIDLREAFRDLSEVETDIENTRTLLLQAKGSKALLNGSSIK